MGGQAGYAITLLYKYNILERMLVENIIPRNVFINQGAAEVDNHISRDDFSTSTLSRMLYLFYYTEHYPFIFYTWCESFKDNAMRNCYK